MNHIPLLPYPDAPSDAAYDDMAIKTELRVLTPEEAQQLQPVFEQADADVPNPATSFIVGITENGKVTESFLTIQMCVHGEPMNVLPKHRPYIKSMVNFAERELVSRIGTHNVFIFVPPNQVKELAEVFGWTEQPWRVLSKIVGPTGDPS